MGSMGKHTLETLPILPLPKGSVLLPGITLRVPVNGRTDIPALLSSVFTKDRRPRPDTTSISIGCVPLNSPLLRSDGLQLIDNREAQEDTQNEEEVVNAGDVDHRNLFMYGTVAKISGVQGRRREDLSLIVEGVRRFRIDRFTQMRPYFEAEVALLNDEGVEVENGRAIHHTPLDLFQQLQRLSLELLALVRISAFLPRSSTNLSPFLARRLELYVSKKELAEAGVLADFMTNIVESTLEDKLRVLAALHITERVQLVIDMLSRQIDGMKSNVKITAITSTTPKGLDIGRIGPGTSSQDIIKRALQGLQGGIPSRGSASGPPDDDADEEPNELEELKRKIEQARLTTEAQKVADRELKRLKKMNPAQAEYGVCRTYIETLSEIPWSAATEDQLGVETLKRARKQLDDDHYGLQKIKKRLLEYLAVLRLKQAVNADIEAQITKAKEEAASGNQNEKGSDSSRDTEADTAKIQILLGKRRVDKSPILLLVGPPGTGKTSLAKSVATALGRRFHRISLGGVRDEAEIRGHRRTYVAAMPGVIVSGLRKVGVNNPVMLLDEIDKVGGSNFHGDPSAAMLEVLDPEQNHSFNDHYVNIPLDLSKVLFIATANTLDTIPPPLLDRMETIALSGYTTVEKRHIANQHLIPKQITTNGLGPDEVVLPENVVDTIITAYTRESGVRNLEREIGSVCRYKAVEYADAKDSEPSKLSTYNPNVSESDLEEILGIERFDEEIAEKKSVPGIVTGLVAYSSGGQGSILFIEVADMPGTGRVQLTGKLGDVLKESVEVALTWVKAHAFELGLTQDANEDIMKNRSVHVHCPSGAIPKDGPSAGLAHTIALISLFGGKAVPPQIAMTGEVSLRGRVMPVGGIKEKLIGALRAGVKTVLLPAHNRKDVKDLPEEVKLGLEIIHVGYVYQVFYPAEKH